ncbi:MAG: Mrp/NBP35 family ATP-binding protein [Halobacteriota archaeon]
MHMQDKIISGKDIVERMGRVKKKIGVMSGKGGVGKSTVSALLAVHLAREGYQVGVYDVDFLGPSIPRLFGIESKKNEMIVSEEGLEPVFTDRLGIRVLSIQFLLPSSETPVTWRGQAINSAIRSFMGGTAFGDLDYLVFDFPPGTGEALLTVLDFVELDGSLMVTIPHDLSEMVVEKAIKMSQKIDSEIIGLVENMSYFKCPTCGEEVRIFYGEDVSRLATKYNIENVYKIPIDLKLSKFAERGRIEDFKTDYFQDFSF